MRHYYHHPLHPVACRSVTKFHHLCLSWASLVSEPQQCCMAFISFFTVLLHDIRGLPLFLLPSGVQCSAVLVIACGSFRSTCPIHLHCLLVLIVLMLSCLHFLSSASSVIFTGQNICSICRRLMVWKERSLARSDSVILQQSDP